MIDYLNELREGCLSAYTGIIQGLRNSASSTGDSSEVPLIMSQMPFLFEFIETIARDVNKSDSLLGSAIGLIGDLVTSYGRQMTNYVERDTIEKLLIEGKRSKVIKTKTLATWASKEIRKIKNN